MNKQAMFETYQGVVVHEPVWVRPSRRNKYGSVPGLDDEELASPEELERNIIRDEWGPVLELPVNGRQGGFRPDVDEDGVVFGAFGSVDFDRIKPGFDKAQYKADKLREQLKDTFACSLYFGCRFVRHHPTLLACGAIGPISFPYENNN